MFQWLGSYCHTVIFHSLVFLTNTWPSLGILHCKSFHAVVLLSSEALIKIIKSLKLKNFKAKIILNVFKFEVGSLHKFFSLENE